MMVETYRVMRPRRLVWITLALAAATAGLAFRSLSPALSPQGVTHVPVWFDLMLGLGGGAGLGWIAARLWRQHRRDSGAAGLACKGWALLAAAVTLRSALFAQADYERGRLAFFATVTVLLAAAAFIMNWRAGNK